MNRCNSIRKTKDDFIFPFFGSIIHTVHFSRMIPPYTVFPINNDLRFSLISGDYIFISQINVSGLSRWLKKRGWDVEEISLPNTPTNNDEGQYSFIPVLRVRKTNHPLTAEISLDVICGASIELWMAESVERQIQAVIDYGNPGNAYTVNFPNTGRYALD